MKLSDKLIPMHVRDYIRRLQSSPAHPDPQEAKLAAARAIDDGLTRAFRDLHPELAQGLLRGLDVPMRTSLLDDHEPYVFVSRIKPYNPQDGFSRRPDHFRAVDDTQFRPGRTRAENSEESERVTRRVQQLIHDIRREPEHLLERLPAFTYEVKFRGASHPERRAWPAMDVLEYALRERNPIVAGIIAAELATLARSADYSEAAMKMLRDCVASAVEIDDGPYASMLLMAMAAAQPPSWLKTRMTAALASDNPVAVTLLYFQQFAGQQLGLDNEAWKAHWLHHDLSIRDFVHTCTADVLLYAAGWELHEACEVAPIHRNHFMHGSMVLTELEGRIAEAENQPVNPRQDARTKREAAITRASRIVEVMRLDPTQCDLQGKISLLNLRIDDMKLSFGSDIGRADNSKLRHRGHHRP